jgi:hypothetical protein
MAIRSVPLSKIFFFLASALALASDIDLAHNNNKESVCSCVFCGHYSPMTEHHHHKKKKKKKEVDEKNWIL